MERSIYSTCFIVLVCLAASGCWQSYSLVQVSGRVTINGVPVEACILNFQPTDHTVGPGSAGRTDKTGNYSLVVATPGKDIAGAVPGEHSVEIAFPASMWKSPEDPIVVMEKFIVPKQGTTEAHFDLSSTQNTLSIQP